METSWGTPKFSNFSKKFFWLLFTSVGMYKKLSKMIGRKSENSGQSRRHLQGTNRANYGYIAPCLGLIPFIVESEP